MILYGLKNCDTCRKAMKALPEATFRDVRKDGVPPAVLEAALLQFGEALVNKRSSTWRGLSDEARSSDPLALIQSNPTLMKRPLIHFKSRFFLSWNSEVEAEVKAML